MRASSSHVLGEMDAFILFKIMLCQESGIGHAKITAQQ